MLQRLIISVMLLVLLSGCEKKVATPAEDALETPVTSDEPIHMLARESAQKIASALRDRGVFALQISKLDSRDIIPVGAFSYFENALVAQLSAAGVQRAPGDWTIQGDLSKQRDQLVFSFELYRNRERIHSDSAQIPHDQRLKNTLAQFELSTAEHDHSVHPDMPVPTPLAELKRIPLDMAENCTGQADCKLLLLYPQELVERNWKDGSERIIPLPVTSLRSRAPSGKILTIENTIFLISNNLIAPLAFHRNLEAVKRNLPSHLPVPEAGLNTYVLSDGRFFDFEEFGSKGLAVIDIKNRLSVAEEGKLVSAEPVVGGTLLVDLPYIYTTSPTVAENNQDTLLKFLYRDGLLHLEKSQSIDGAVYAVAMTDLNRDQKREMLVAVRNTRGIFIEVHEPL